MRACCPTRSRVGRGVPTAPRASEGARNLRDWTTCGGAVGTPRPTFKLAEYLGNTPPRRLLRRNELFGGLLGNHPAKDKLLG